MAARPRDRARVSARGHVVHRLRRTVGLDGQGGDLQVTLRNTQVLAWLASCGQLTAPAVPGR
jgi:hypothetical protein